MVSRYLLIIVILASHLLHAMDNDHTQNSWITRFKSEIKQLQEATVLDTTQAVNNKLIVTTKELIRNRDTVKIDLLWKSYPEAASLNDWFAHTLILAKEYDSNAEYQEAAQYDTFALPILTKQLKKTGAFPKHSPVLTACKHTRPSVVEGLLNISYAIDEQLIHDKETALTWAQNHNGKDPCATLVLEHYNKTAQTPIQIRPIASPFASRLTTTQTYILISLAATCLIGLSAGLIWYFYPKEPLDTPTSEDSHLMDQEAKPEIALTNRK